MNRRIYKIGMSVMYEGRVHVVVGIHHCKLEIMDIGDELRSTRMVYIEDL